MLSMKLYYLLEKIYPHFDCITSTIIRATTVTQLFKNLELVVYELLQHSEDAVVHIHSPII